MAGGKRRAIGLSIDDVLMVGGQKALNGALDAALEAGADLYCFRKDFSKGDSFVPPAWEAIGEILDGLVIYQAWPDEATFSAFRSRFQNLPAVNGVRLYSGCPGMTPDSYQGFKELLGHLVEVHGLRRIAFLAGPEGNWSADERERAYRDFHAEREIEARPALVTPRLGWGDGNRGVAILLDERGLKPGRDFDAIAAANDTIAMGALDELRSRGVQVPDGTALVGFDDDARAQFTSPPITTVEYDMGRHAAKTLLALVNGETVPERSFVPTRIVVRRSCGCLTPAVAGAAVPAAPRAKAAPWREALRAERAGIVAAAVGAFNAADGDPARWIGSIVDALASELSFERSTGSFVSAVEGAMAAARSDDSEPEDWQRVISVLRGGIAPLIEPALAPRAEDLWHQARVAASEAARRGLAFEARNDRIAERSFREIEASIRGSLGLSGLMDGLAKSLGRLGIPSCFVALYENEREARLALACEADASAPGGVRRPRLPDGSFPAARLLPPGAASDRRRSFMVERLSFQSRELGYALFELGPRDGALYMDLSSAISSALQGALLIDQARTRSVSLDAIVNQTLSASEAIRASFRETADLAKSVSNAARASMDVSAAGKEAVQQTISGMQTVQRQVEDISASIGVLTDRTKQIEKIIGALEDIVAQSDILAINAGIQAARAGNAGQGFGVVAREIRSLAERSRASTADISQILNDIRKATESAVDTTRTGSAGAREGMVRASKAGDTIESLQSAIEEAARATLGISAGIDRQSAAMDDLVAEVSEIKEASERTSTSFKDAGLES